MLVTLRVAKVCVVKQLKGIFWTCNDDERLCCGHFFCKKHLDMSIIEWYTDGKVTVRQPDGEDVETKMNIKIAEYTL